MRLKAYLPKNDKYHWPILEQKSQCEVEVRQAERHGTITELTATTKRRKPDTLAVNFPIYINGQGK